MSAIGAIFATDGVRVDQLEAMLASLAVVPHDATGIWHRGTMGLAAAAYHTTSEAREQPQPCISEDGTLAAVFAGYLLNPDELARDLSAKGARLRNRSDIELALCAYEVWGEDCAPRLEGEFSLIIADGRAGRLFITRDHLGFVPLFYREEHGRLVVATDFRTLAALSDTPLEPDHLYLAQAMANRWCLREATRPASWD